MTGHNIMALSRLPVFLNKIVGGHAGVTIYNNKVGIDSLVGKMI